VIDRQLSSVRTRRLIVGVVLAAGLIAAGCELFKAPSVPRHSPGRTSARPESRPDIYPVAVWYYVRSYVPELQNQARNVMTGDFAHLRSLGFNTIVADAIEDDRRALLLDVAQRQSVRVILPHNGTTAYIRGGRSDRTVRSSPASVVGQNVQRVGHHPALFMHYVYDAPFLDVVDRLARIVKQYQRQDPGHPVFVSLSQDVAALARQADLPMVLWDNFPLAEDAGPGELRNRRYDAPPTHADALAEIYAQTPDRQHWAMIQALAMPGRIRMPAPAEWSVIYLTSLAAGFVDGVVFYRYHAAERPDSGLASANHTMSPERTAAVRRITRRALKWGPMLRRSRPSPQTVRTEDGRLRAVLLIGPKRRFLLAFNPDVVTFGYDTLYIPTTVQGQPVARAVNVDELKRFVSPAGRAEIAVKLRLRPGEGCLLELFGP